MRDPDLLDYGFIVAITVLAYLEFPWRPELRAFLRHGVEQVTAVGGVYVYVLALVVVGAVFVVFVAKMLPRY